MKLHFLGANRQVTGSRYCLEAGGTEVMVDCGLFQERPFESRNWEPSPVPPASIDALLLTHVHIDHSGLIPKLVREGFSSPIYCTRPSSDLLGVLLEDSAEIQMEDAAYKLRRHQKEGRRGKYPEVPLYTLTDVEKTLPLVRGVPYGKPLQVTPAISVVFRDAGHILGSAMLEVSATENGQTRQILFSGDIGQWNKPLIRDPTLPSEADYVIMESTYGDRRHEEGGDVAEQLAAIINDTVGRGGNVVIPTFAVERAQELMYYISQLIHSNRIPDLQIFLDSPMSVDVTEIYRRHSDSFDRETWKRIASGQTPLRFPGLRLVRTTEESKAINRGKQPSIIMATSGMCTSGRIKHHLRQNLGRPESTVLFVGYQGQGTLGRQILEGAPEVRIHGKLHKVKARVTQIYGFSGHADQAGLLRWITNLTRPPRSVFLTHGEERVSLGFAELIGRQTGWPVTVPEYQQTIELN